MKKVIIINGPNLNMLGAREPRVYGDLNLEKIIDYTEQQIKKNSTVQIQWYQSNIEGEIVEKIQTLVTSDIDALIINPAGYSHTSVDILDALKMLKIPVIEVHLTNVYARESFRQTLLTAQAASIIMSGLGKDAYYLALLALLNKED